VAGGPLLTAVAPGLGAAGSFAVLGGSTVTNTGSSNVTGDLGVAPGSAVTGFPPGQVTGGSIHAADAVALQAQSDAGSIYNNLAGQACDFDLTGQELAGKTLTPGVYCFSSSAGLNGSLNLDFQGVSGAVFVFKIGSTLVTGSSASVHVINGGSVCNVFWQVGSSATLGTGTNFVGNIVAQASVTLNTGASVDGRAFARTGAVTMANNNVSNNSCYRAHTATPTLTATATVLSASSTPTSTPDPAAPTATATVEGPTATATVEGPTATATVEGPTATATVAGPTATATVAGPTATATVAGPTATATVAGPTATATVAGPTATPTVAGPTATPRPPTATPNPQQATATPIPQQATATPIPQQPTATPIPQQATATPAPIATAVVIATLPKAGDPPNTDKASLVLASAGTALVGLSVMLRRRRYQ
jgi:type VI secretion system secreted protein VgrG